MNKKICQFSSQVESVKTMRDGGNKIVIETQELTPESLATLFSFGGKQIWTALCEVDIEQDDLKIPDEIMEFKNQKSQSERIRAVLFLYWDKNKPTKTFDEFYKMKTEEFIKIIKDKLN